MFNLTHFNQELLNLKFILMFFQDNIVKFILPIMDTLNTVEYIKFNLKLQLCTFSYRNYN